MMKKVTPKKTATPVMMWMKCSISRAIGVLPVSRPEARPAMRPITVLSPQLTTIPRAVPVVRQSNNQQHVLIKQLSPVSFSLLLLTTPREPGSVSKIYRFIFRGHRSYEARRFFVCKMFLWHKNMVRTRFFGEHVS